MRQFAFTQSAEDHTLFLHHSANKIVALIIYVDDIVIIEDDMSRIRQVKDYLSRSFEIKDLDQLHYFLGIEVA